MAAKVSGTVAYWLIEASRDGVVFDKDTFVEGGKGLAERLAKRLQDTHPEGWIPGVVFEVKPLTRAEFFERLVA